MEYIVSCYICLWWRNDIRNMKEYLPQFEDGSFLDTHSPIFGGLNAIKKELFYRVKGCEESFKNWGAEDIFFGHLLSKITKVGRSTACAVHLYHYAAPGSEHKGNVEKEPNWLKFLRFRDTFDTTEKMNEYIELRDNNWGNLNKYKGGEVKI